MALGIQNMWSFLTPPTYKSRDTEHAQWTFGFNISKRKFKASYLRNGDR